MDGQRAGPQLNPARPLLETVSGWQGVPGKSMHTGILSIAGNWCVELGSGPGGWRCRTGQAIAARVACIRLP